MKIEILSTASQDLIDGYHFYENQSEGVGSYFLDSRILSCFQTAAKVNLTKVRNNLKNLYLLLFPATSFLHC